MTLYNFVQLSLISDCKTPKLMIEPSFPFLGAKPGQFIAADLKEIIENEKFKEILDNQVLSVGVYNGMLIITI